MTSNITKEWLRETLAQITPGPWSYEVEEYGSDNVRAGKEIVALGVGDDAQTQADCTLIAELPDLARLLLEKWEECDRHIEALKSFPAYPTNWSAVGDWWKKSAEIIAECEKEKE